MAVKKIFQDFGEWTSAHGIPHIASAQHICLRIFWALVFLAATGMFLFELIQLVDKYLDYEVTVQTELMFEERPFPAVTICNASPYRKQLLNQFEDSRSVDRLLKEYRAAMLNDFSSAPNDEFGLKKLAGNPTAIMARAADLALFLSSNISDATKKSLMYSNEEFIQNCAYNTKPCNVTKDFSLYIDPVYGVCYVFNNNASPYRSSRAGPLYGLRMLVQSNQSEYLDFIETGGVRITIQNQTEVSFPDAFGYNVAAGLTTSFGVKLVETVRKEAPYGNCTDSLGKSVFYYDGPFSTEACFRSCLQRNIISTCNCADPRYNRPVAAIPYCTIDQMDCISKYTEGGLTTNGSTASTGFDLTKCACPQPCNESTFSVTASTAGWPSQVYTPPLCTQGALQWNGDLNQCHDWYEQNTMLIEIYFERMNYQKMTEIPAYLFVNLMSDVGGQLGLWSGCSFISIIEFVFLPAMLVLFCCSSPTKSPVRQTTTPKPLKGYSNDPPPPYSEAKPPTPDLPGVYRRK